MLQLLRTQQAVQQPCYRALASWATVDPQSVSGSNVAQAFNLGANLLLCYSLPLRSMLAVNAMPVGNNV
jgi:hypothetical protein